MSRLAERARVPGEAEHPAPADKGRRVSPEEVRTNTAAGALR